MLNSGCLGLFGSEEDQTENIDCQSQPTHPDCFEEVVTEDDCTSQQVFTGESCRLMLPPSQLSYGEDSITLIVGLEMQALTPSFQGDGPQNWFVNPRLPDGLNIDESGVISGTPQEASESTQHTVIATNTMGSSSTSIDIAVGASAPESVQYLSDTLACTLDSHCSLDSPMVTGAMAESWSADPPLPMGLELLEDGSISGIARTLGDSNHTIFATNSGGSAEVDLRIITLHEAPNSLMYPGHPFYWTIGQQTQAIPSYGGGQVNHWLVEPPLPPGILLHQEDGSLRGTPSDVYPLREYIITAYNTGGSISTTILIDVRDLVVAELRYDPSTLDLIQGEDIGQIEPTWEGGSPDTWEIDPPLPTSFSFDIYTGSISGIATLLQPWTYHTIWANNSGGSVGLLLWIAVHDLRADQSDLLRGMGETNWGGWPSPILPIGEWAFPIGFTEEGYGSSIPVISASHVGRGKMLGYGHESWVDGAGVAETEFSLRAVEWVCGENADVGLAYGAGFDDFVDELQAEGHTVHLSLINI